MSNNYDTQIITIQHGDETTELDISYMDEHEIEEAIQELLEAHTTPCDWSVIEYEGFEPFDPGTDPDLAQLAECVRGLQEHGEAFAVYCNNIGVPDVKRFEDSYLGDYSAYPHPTQEFAAQAFEGALHIVPASLQSYIDLEALANDLFCDGYWEQDGFVFSNI